MPATSPILAETAFRLSGMSAVQIAMLALAVACLTMLMLSTRRKLRERQVQPQGTARQRYAELEQKAKAKRDLEEVMLELDELSRQVHGRLDTKFAKLEAVIRDADRRIDQLTRLLRASSGGPACDITLRPEDPMEQAPEPASKDDPHAAIHRLADAGWTAPQIADETGKPVGEIELILALRRTKREAEGASGLVRSGPSDREH
jgi:hypothetical protein